MTINNMLDYAIENKASDVHIKTNRPTQMRIKKRLITTEFEINERQLIDFLKEQDINLAINKSYHDFAFSYKGRRFRAHMFKSMTGINIALRLLAETVPKFESLNLPVHLKATTNLTKGLVLICGATGSGKSTTIASLIDHINNTQARAIITIEDPIEYVYTEAQCVIEQREVGTHTESFTQATVDAMRQDPDIIVLGEMRDLDTIKNAITLAETGHLVYGTIHSKSVVDTLDRIIDVFPPEQQTQIRSQLSSILATIFHQQMLHTNNGVVVVSEMMIMDSVLANMLKQENTKANQIRDYMRTKKDEGNEHIVDNILWHMEHGRIQEKDVEHILTPDEFRQLGQRSVVSRQY